MEGEDQVRDLFKKDITIKLISGLAAIVIWLYVVDVQNPEIEKTIRGVNVSFINQQTIAEFGLSVVDGQNQTVDVRIKGRTRDVAGINNDNVKAVADLTGFNRTGEFSIPVQVQLPVEGLQIIDKKPYNIPVKLDKLIQMQKAVIVNYQGSPRESYSVLQAQVTPNNVTLKGPASILNTIDSLRVDINLAGQDKDIVTKQKYKIYNKNGEEIVNNSIEKDVEIVEIVCPIIQTKTVSIIPEFTGTLPNKEIAIAKTEVLPSVVKISSRSQGIDKITSISTQPINLSTIEDTTELDVSIRIPSGVQLAEQVSSVKVRINIEKQVSRTITVSVQDINIINVPEDFSYRLLTKSLDVVVKGIQSKVDAIKAADLHASIDMKNAAEGQHDLPVNFTTNSGVDIVGSYMATVSLSHNQDNNQKPSNNSPEEQNVNVPIG